MGPSDPIFKKIADTLRLDALTTGSRVELRAHSYYNQTNRALYVSDFAGGVYRVTSDRNQTRDERR